MARRESIGAGARPHRRTDRRRNHVRSRRSAPRLRQRRRRRNHWIVAGHAHRSNRGGTATLTWIVILHVFGVIMWVGSLLVITALMKLALDEVGAAREALIVAAKRLIAATANIAA